MKEVVLILAILLAVAVIIFVGGGFVAYVQSMMNDFDDDLLDYDENE